MASLIIVSTIRFMRIRNILLAALMLGAVSIGVASGGDAPKATLASIPGRFTIYNIADLTRGNRDMADQIGNLVRSTVTPDAWDKTAVMRVAPTQITAKYSDQCPDEMRGDIDALLEQLRESRNLYVKIEYRLVVSDQVPKNADPDGFATGVSENHLEHGREVVSNSEITIPNGEEGKLWDGADLNLPTISACPAISADRKAVTIVIYDSSKPDYRHKPVAYSVPDGQTVAVRINDPVAHEWLIVRTIAFKQEAADLLPSPKLH
jgi:hypothetical protein